MKKAQLFLLAILLAFTAACSATTPSSAPDSPTVPSQSEGAAFTPGVSDENELDYSDWEAVVQAARGTVVTHVGYGGDDALNEWIMGPFAETLKEKYDITLE